MDLANILVTDDRTFDYLIKESLQRFILKENNNNPQKPDDITVKDAAYPFGEVHIAGMKP